MAKVTWSAGIDSVSGALSKPSKSGQHSCTKMLLGTHRIADTKSNACNRLYLRPKIERSTPVTAGERWARTRFTAISRAVRARMKDLMHIAADQEAFLAQKDLADGQPTLYSYLWALERDTYDAEHPRA